MLHQFSHMRWHGEGKVDSTMVVMNLYRVLKKTRQNVRCKQLLGFPLCKNRPLLQKKAVGKVFQNFLGVMGDKQNGHIGVLRQIRDGGQ